MASTLKVDTSQIEAAKNKIEGLKGEFEDSWNKVLANNDELKNTWSGVDNQAFANQVEGFKDDFEALTNNLEAYIAFLTKARAEYAKAQTDMKTEASKLKADRK